MAISEHPLRRAVSAGIRYGLDFASFDAAATTEGIDLFRWDSGGYPPRFMARVFAWHNLKSLIGTHTEDARNTAAEKNARKK